jgi:hypothetical protein
MGSVRGGLGPAEAASAEDGVMGSVRGGLGPAEAASAEDGPRGEGARTDASRGAGPELLHAFSAEWADALPPAAALQQGSGPGPGPEPESKGPNRFHGEGLLARAAAGRPNWARAARSPPTRAAGAACVWQGGRGGGEPSWRAGWPKRISHNREGMAGPRKGGGGAG